MDAQEEADKKILEEAAAMLAKAQTYSFQMSKLILFLDKNKGICYANGAQSKAKPNNNNN